jgi:hypothetical protein
MKLIDRVLGAWLASTILSNAAYADAPPASQPLPFDRIPTSITDTPVLDRNHPGYEPSGTSLGDFILYTQVGLTEFYNTNLYATNTNQVADAGTALRPELLLKSRWAQNLLQLDVRGDIERYFNRPNEAVNDGGVSLTGRYDGPDYFGFTGLGEFSDLTEPRSSTLSPRDVVQPIKYDLAHVRAQASKDLERLKLSLTGDAYQTTYQNGETPGGATVLETIYDTRELFVDGSAAYVVDPDVAVVAHIIGNERHFLNPDIDPTTNTPIDRDSAGVEATIGVNLSLTHLIRGEVLVGYLDQNYQDTNLYRPVTGPSAHVKLLYLPTGLTTVSFTADRKVNDAQDPVAISFVSTAGKIEVDHELYRNIILTAAVKYEEDVYAGIDRQDFILDSQASVNYLLDRRYSLKFTFDNFDVDSRGSAGIPSYAVRQISVALVTRF